MARVRLHVVSQKQIDSNVELSLLVDREWLLPKITWLDAQKTNGFVQLNISARMMHDWIDDAPTGLYPFLRFFQGTFQLKTEIFRDNWRISSLSVSGSGAVRRLPDENGLASYQCTLKTGAVVVSTNHGFTNQSDFFINGSTSEFQNWLRRLWPEVNSQPAAVSFGRDTILVDVLTTFRRRMELMNDRSDAPIWKLSNCRDLVGLRTPQDEIGDLRKRIDQHLEACNWKRPGNEKVATERRSLATQSPAEVYYSISIVNNAYRIDKYLRPDFDIRFRDGASTIQWSPRTAITRAGGVELHDADHVEALLNAIALPADPDPTIRLEWKKPSGSPAGSLPSLVVAQLPTSSCVGISNGEVQEGYVWQYATTSTTPANYPRMPILVRYQFPEYQRQTPATILPANVEGPIPISAELLPDHWGLTISPQLPRNANPQAANIGFPVSKTMSLNLTEASGSRGIELRVFSGSITATSPPLLRFTDRLADPASVPNAKTLAGVDLQRDPLETTSLVFASEPREVQHYFIRNLGPGEDISSPQVIWQSHLRKDSTRVTQVTITPRVGATGFNGTSVWTIKVRAPDGTLRDFIAKSFTVFPAANVTTSLGSIANPDLQPGEQLELTVVNSNSVDLSEIDLHIEFDTIAPLVMQPKVASNLASFHLFSNSPDAVQLNWPHAPTALIDPIPAAARNLRQTRDIETLRTIIERDASHGTVAWSVSSFRLTLNAGLQSREGGAEVAMLDAITNFAPLRAQLHSAMAMLPWVACRDQLGGVKRHQLHTRNLVLEPGEFAAASQDRTIDGRPMAFANNETDFIEAVRDPFTQSVSELPVHPQPHAEIVNWLPGAKLNVTPSARLTLPTAQSPLPNRFPEVGLRDIGAANSTDHQFLKVLYRDGTEPSTVEPTDWLTYLVRRNDWERQSNLPVRVNFEIVRATHETPAKNQARLARNASVPLLFDYATVTCADVRSGAGLESEVWVALGDDRGRVVVLDLARPTQRHFLRAGALIVQSAMQGLVLGRINNTDWLVTLDASGDSHVWKTNQGIQHWQEVNTLLPNQGQVRFAAGCQVSGLIAFFLVAPGNSGAKVVVWNPTGNTSTVINNLPGISPADIADARLIPFNNQLLLAVAHNNGHPAVVLRGEANNNNTVWQFNAMPFASAVTGSRISIAVVQNEIVVGTTESNTNCKLWKADTQNQLNPLNNTIPPSSQSIIAIAIGSRPDAPAVLRPVAPWESAGFVYLADQTGKLTACGFHLEDDESTVERTVREFLGHHGTPDHLLALNLNVLTRCERAPVSTRPHLVAFGAEGIFRIWDSDSQQLHRAIDAREDVYDNLGTLRNVRIGQYPSPITYVEPINRPGRIDVAHTSNDSKYAPFGSIVDYSLVPDDDTLPLLEFKQDPESVSELYLVCDRLRLRKTIDPNDPGHTAVLWVPESLADDLNPGPDRPTLKFPFHRGDVGRYGMYSRIVGESPMFAYWPRIAGLPIYPTQLNWLKFDEVNNQVDFSLPSEMEFEAAIVNPLEVAGPQDNDSLEQLPPFVQRAIHDGSVVRIQLKKINSRLEVASLTTIDNNLFKWNLPITADIAVHADEGLEGHLSKVVGTIGYEKFKSPVQNGDSTVGRIVLRLDPGQCAAELLGGQSNLDGSILPGQKVILVGYGERINELQQKTFGFETPRAAAAIDSPEMLPLPLARTADRVQVTAELTALAVDELQTFHSAITGAADFSLTWWDFKTATSWSNTKLDAVPNALSAARFEVPFAFLATGTRFSAHEVELKYRWVPGSPLLSTDFRTDWSNGQPITAMAAYTDVIFFGNAAGALSCWDMQGKVRFEVSLFGGPVIQLVACRNRNTSTPLLAAIDSTQRRATIVSGHSGEVLRTISNVTFFGGAPENTQLRNIDFAEIEGALYLAAVGVNSSGESIASWLKLPTITGNPEQLGGVLSSIQAVAIGREGSEAALYVATVSDTPELRRQPANGSLVTIGNIPGPTVTIAFADDNSLQFIVAASPNQQLVVWETPSGTTAWVQRTVGVTPSDSGSRQSVSLEQVADKWFAIVGPGERLGDDVRLLGRALDAISLEGSGEIKYRYSISARELTNCGLLGPRIATSRFGMLHAVVARDSKTDLKIIDLLSGHDRSRGHAFEHNSSIFAVRWVNQPNATRMLSVAQHKLFSWNPADGSQVTYDLSEDAVALVADGEFAAYATNVIRIWRWMNGPDDQNNFVEISTSNSVPTKLAIRVTPAIILVAIATVASDSSRRVELWQVPRQLTGTAILKKSWTVNHEVIDLVILNDDHVATTLLEPGPHVRLAIFDLGPNTTVPTERWQRALQSSANLSGRLCQSGERPVLVDDRSVEVWSLSPYLSLSSDGKLDCCLPIALQATPLADLGTLTADLDSTGVNVHLTTAQVPNFPQRLIPGSVYTGTFGFIGRVPSPGSDAGSLAGSLWRNVQGRIAGGFLFERNFSHNVTLKNSATSSVSLPAQADLLQHQFLAFNPDATPAVRTTVTTTGRITASLLGGKKLSLYVGDQQWEISATAATPTFFAHLVWQVGNEQVQGPVLVHRTGTNEYKLDNGVYRLQEIASDWEPPSPSLLEIRAEDLLPAVGTPSGILVRDGITWNLQARADYNNAVLGLTSDNSRAGVGGSDGSNEPTYLDQTGNELLGFDCTADTKIVSLSILPAAGNNPVIPHILVADNEILLEDIVGAVVPRDAALTISNVGLRQFGFGGISLAVRESNLQHPLSDGKSAWVDLAFPKIDASPTTRYARFLLTASGVQIRTVSKVDIPFDLCLDSDIIRPLPSIGLEVPQLSHRQLLGTRLRHEAIARRELLTVEQDTLEPLLPANSHWLAAPVVKAGMFFRILTQSAVVTSATDALASTLQTENLILLSRDDTDNDSLGTAVGLHNLTGEAGDQYLLSDAEIDVRITGNEAAGTIFHRVLRRTQAALFRIIPRANTSVGAPSASFPPGQIVQYSSTVDFRMLTPLEACRVRRIDGVRYLSEEPAVDPAIDCDRFAWRRFGFADVLWSDHPQRAAANGKFGFLMNERIAFHRLQLPALPPSEEAIFPATTGLANTFRPRCIEMQLAPDKPGAMVHHTFQAIESSTAVAIASLRLPRPPGVAVEPCNDFAMREPLQLAPPNGTNLKISKAEFTPLKHRQAARIELEWKETLGALPVESSLGTDVPLLQIDLDLSAPPEKSDVKVGFSEQSPFVMMAVRINDEYFELNAKQPQFPVYDARQSASSHVELQDKTKLLASSNIIVELGEKAIQLDAAAANSKSWAMGVGTVQAKIWDLSSSAPNTPAAEISFSQASPTAVFATHKGELRVLCNDDGANPGVFLLDRLSNGTTTEELSDTVASDVRFMNLTSLVQRAVNNAPNIFELTDLEIYAAAVDNGGDAKLQIHFQESTGNSPRRFLEIGLGVSADPDVTLQMTGILNDSRDPSKGNTLYVAFGGGTTTLRDIVKIFKIDFSTAAPGGVPTFEFVNQLTIETLTAFCITSIADQPVLLVGDKAGFVKGLNATNGAERKQFAHAAKIEQITVAEAAGRKVIAVVCEMPEDIAGRVSIWDFEAESLLRTTQDLDKKYGLIQPLTLANNLYFVAEETLDQGRLEIFDPLLSPYRPPELYFVSKAPLLVPKVVSIHYTDNGPQAIDVSFKPYLVLTDRQNSSVTYKSDLNEVLESLDTSGTVKIWKLRKLRPDQNRPNIDLRWHQAGQFRIAWLNEEAATVFPEHTLEAVLFAPLGDKQIKPVPYSEVAPKIAGVALVDDSSSGNAVEVFQRTLFFGDAATAGGGSPLLVPDANSPSELIYQAIGSENVDLSLSDASNEIKFALVKHLVNGQAIGTSTKVQPSASS